MRFSIIVPSFNQENFIAFTLNNLVSLKEKAAENLIDVEILLYDAQSNAKVQEAIEKYRSKLDYVEIQNDKGQYDAINKGIKKCRGDYWTWLNTDDLLDIDGFLKVTQLLQANRKVDYIYGNVAYIDEKQNYIKTVKTWELDLKTLVRAEPAIFQPGSWFKKEFSEKIGYLAAYECCFDYEYILRLLKNKAVFFRCDFDVASFRFYAASKTGSKTVKFIKEQQEISKTYGRRWYHYLTFFSNLRLFKHFLFPRK
jgi:glycosyltransferase involved in cell wall biosynthesis